MKSLYISGNSNVSGLNKAQNVIIESKVRAYRSNIGILENVEAVIDSVYKIMTPLEKCKLLQSRIGYAIGPKPLRKALLIRAIELSYNMTLTKEQFVDELLHIYLKERTGNDAEVAFESLKSLVENPKKMFITTALKPFF